MSGWYGFDFDGTLAKYDHWRGADHAGEPIQERCEQVRLLLKEGKDVRIFTARVYVPDDPSIPEGELQKRYLEARESRRTIDAFCEKHFHRVLPVTCVKDFGMICLWDDRCVQVVPNTGQVVEDLLKCAEKDSEWYRGVIAEECGYDAPAGDGCNPLREILRANQHSSPWIATKTRLPQISGIYIVQFVSGTISVEYFDTSRGKWGPLNTDLKIEYWQPMPERFRA